MKPIFLEISAWGPYKDCEKIDFESFGNKGIFLITGATGAGKTTIFDAICFALYGRVSGTLRGKESLRSDFAKKDVKTYVEMTFCHMNKIYRIRRNPKYKKPKLRGNGITDENESAVLYLEDTVLAEGVTNVNEKIKEVLGLEYEQFKQISMIAQGEFQKLLTADSQERTKIFRSIFKTQLYEKMQEMLKIKALDLKKKLDDLKSKTLEVINLVDIDEAKWNEIVDAKSINYSKVIDYLEDRKTSQKEKEKEYTKYLVEIEKNVQELISLKNQKEQLEENYKQYDIETKNLEEAEKRASEIEKLKTRLEKIYRTKEIMPIFTEYDISRKNMKILEEDINILTNKYNMKIQEFQLIDEKYQNRAIFEKEEKEKLEYISVLENQFDIYKQYVEIDKEYEIQKSELEFSKVAVEKNKEILEKAQIQIEECVKKLELVEKAQKDILEQNNKIIKLDVIIDEILHYQKKNNELDNLKRKYENVIEEYKNREEKYLEMQEIYIDIDSAFRMATAGILASELKDNEPCPVCGSIKHPKKAVLCETVPKKEMVDKAKENVEICRVQAEEKAKDVAIIKGRLDLATEEIEDIIKKISVKDIKEVENELANYISEKNELKNKINDMQAIVESKDSYEKYRLRAENGKAEYTEKLNLETKKLEKINNMLQNIFGKREALEKSLKIRFDNIEGYQNEIRIQKEKYTNMKIGYENMLERHKKLLSEVETSKGILEDNKKKYENNQIEVKKLYSKFEENYIKKGFKNEEEYLMCEKDAQNEQGITNEIKEYDENTMLLIDRINKIKNDINGEPRPNLEVYIKKLDEVNTKRIEYLANKDEIMITYTNTKKCLESLKEKMVAFTSLEKEYGKISELNSVTVGNNSQKLMFEQYILSNYFDDILQSANMRLSKMTDGRYELFRIKGVMDARTKNALDIEVLDNYTGKMRHINTLSGGESFKAALSLAFGTSDIMQNNVGGIVADTLFIDEGFGALDNESLQQAINILTSMAGTDRLIGIISHVGELKEQIRKQIVIEKTNNGSTIRCQTE